MKRQNSTAEYQNQIRQFKYEINSQMDNTMSSIVEMKPISKQAIVVKYMMLDEYIRLKRAINHVIRLDLDMFKRVASVDDIDHVSMARFVRRRTMITKKLESFVFDMSGYKKILMQFEMNRLRSNI